MNSLIQEAQETNVEESGYREKINRIKDGLEKAGRINDFKKNVSTCTELELFILIDKIGYIMWRTEHDLSHGRYEYPEWDANDKFVMEAEIELAVEQTYRFGVIPFKNGSYYPTESYTKWYRLWKDYIEGLDAEKWKEVATKLENGEDCSMFHP